MAPMKRPSSSVDDGDYQLIEVDSASAGLRPVPKKKPRRSPTEEHSIRSEQTSDEEEGFLEQASQFVTEQKSKGSITNTPAENGVIESVTCVNFMCHKHLAITLGPLINFITGQNGSGKSAILAAITICLGGKATATNRGGSLKNFIKNGEESSMLSIKLKNMAESAYQHDVYGDSIIIERHFSRSGASGFKLKSSTGRVISTRKGDLDDICDYFALQIDNPMNVLTQDMARQFLNSSSPQEKYKFFMKGTQLEHLDGDYMIVEQNVEMIDADLWKKLQDVEEIKERASKAEHLHRMSQKTDELIAKIQALSDMMAWAQVEEQEDKLAAANRALDETNQKIASLQARFDSLGEGFRQSEDAHGVALRHVEEAELALTPLNEKKESVKATHDKHKSDQIDIQAEQRQISSAIKGVEKRISSLESEIQEEERRLGDADGGVHAQNRRVLEEKKEDVEQAKSRLAAHNEELPRLQEAKRQVDKDYETSKRPIRDKQDEIQRAETRMNALIQDRGQQQNAYHPAMPRLLKAIRDDRGFREKPVGPIGNHVRLLKPSWSSVLEKQFGGVLDSFIVTSKSDQMRLSGLMQQIKCNSPILIGNHDPIDLTGHEPDPEYDTTLRVLEIDNDLVRKQLIIGQAIDQTILIPERSRAVELLGDSRLRNVKQCFTHNVQPGTGVRLAYGFGGDLSENFIPGFQGNPRMKTDIESQISNQRDVVQNLKSHLNRLDEESRMKRADMQQCSQAIAKHDKDASLLRRQLQEAESIVEQMQDEVDNGVTEEGRLDSLREQMKECQEEKSTYESSYQDSVNAKDNTYMSIKSTREEMAAMDKEIDEAQENLTRAQNRANIRAEQRETALREKNVASDSVTVAEREREVRIRARDEENSTLENWVQAASDICQRVPVDAGETADAIERKIYKLDADRKTAESRLGMSREEIANQAARSHEEYRRAHSEVEAFEQLTQLLKTTLVHRRDRWRRFQKYITSRARIQFFYQLSERGYRGKLLANHKEKKLDLQVEPDETRTNAKGRSTHGLSGGEKSFSTICLLLSLWEAMGAPVRCLDEFDVFMDSVNREISMEMLVRFARESVGKQFILITPQNMGKINPDAEDITVVKMADPVRGGQTRLNFPVEE